MSAILWKFQFSTTASYILEVGEHYIQFFTDGAPVLDGDSNPYVIWTPYLSADLLSLQYKQINDVVYICHPSYAVRKLSRLGNANWTLEEVAFQAPPTLDENISDTTITPTPIGGNQVSLTASADVFQPGHAGSTWRIGHLRDSAYIEFGINSNFTTISRRILGDWTFHTYGVWSADIRVERINDAYVNGVYTEEGWETVRKWSGRSDRNIDAEGTSEEDAYYRIVCSNYTAGNGGRVLLEAVDAMIYGIFKIVSVSDARTAVAEIIVPPERYEPTIYWQEAAFSDYRGHPRTVTIHEQRLMFGGSAHFPSRIWGSVIGDYENFLKGSDDDASLAFDLAGEELHSIQWMVSQKDLIVGTTGGEWRVGSQSTEKPLTPSTIDAKQHTSYGSEYIQAQIVDGVILFVQRKGRRVREMTYSYEVDKYVSTDLTLLAEHITEGGIIQMAYQQAPLPLLWCVTSTGKLICLTYARDQQVVGWHRHILGGDATVESVATIYGAGDDDDEVWFIANRGGTRFIERINPHQWSAKEDAYFVDCGITYDGSPISTLSGLDHLNGYHLATLEDGAVAWSYPDPDHPGQFGTITVVDGSIILRGTASKVHAGLAYTSRLQPMRLDADPTIGSSMGHIRRIAEIVIRVRDSLAIKVYDGVNTFRHTFRNDVEDTYNAHFVTPSDPTKTWPLFSGDSKLNVQTDLAFDAAFIVIQENPLPTVIQALIVKTEVSGK